MLMRILFLIEKRAAYHRPHIQRSFQLTKKGG
jgi:hypothetical protein